MENTNNLAPIKCTKCSECQEFNKINQYIINENVKKEKLKSMIKDLRKYLKDNGLTDTAINNIKGCE